MKKKRKTEALAPYTTYAHGHEAVPTRHSSPGRLTIRKIQSIGQMYGHYQASVLTCFAMALLTTIRDLDEKEAGSLVHLDASYQFYHGLCTPKHDNTRYNQRFRHHIRRTNCSAHLCVPYRLRLGTHRMGSSQRTLWPSESKSRHLLSIYYIHYGLRCCSNVGCIVDLSILLWCLCEFTHCHRCWHSGRYLR